MFGQFQVGQSNSISFSLLCRSVKEVFELACGYLNGRVRLACGHMSFTVAAVAVAAAAATAAVATTAPVMAAATSERRKEDIKPIGFFLLHLQPSRLQPAETSHTLRRNEAQELTHIHTHNIQTD